ncbi:O-antigen ligase family protein [Modestobacter marinus]|uniref:O-antigen ligase family protein n=1 Tax=Modestobacter marinus TaxID=477641 RepID=UPI001C963F2C|nr:O-antigen ligase family protein [Modestobacter marinus]
MTAPAEPRLRMGALWPLVPAVAVVAVVAGALTSPLLTAVGALGLGVLVVSVRWPLATGIAFLIAGPMYLSEFEVGPMTLDNVAVLYGSALAVVWLLGRTWQVPTVAAWPISLAVAAAVAAVANGGAGAAGIVRFASLAVTAVVVANAGPHARRMAAAGLEAAVTLGALVLLAQPLTSFPDPYQTWGEGVGLRYGGLFGHPNFAAYTVSLVLLYQLYTRRFTAWRAASAVSLLLALVLTGSRAALLVFALLMVPALWLRARRFFLLLVPAVLALPFVGQTIITRFEVISQTGGLSGSNASGWRFGQWADALAATRGHEFLGIGWGQTREVLTDNLGAHSTYIQIWLEVGRVGAALAAIGLVLLIRSARSHVARILVAYAALTGISDPVLVYPCCATALLVLLAALHTPAGEEATAPDGGEAAAPDTPTPSVPARRPEVLSR